MSTPGLNPVFETRRLPTTLAPSTAPDSTPLAVLVTSPMREASAQQIRPLPGVSTLPGRATLLAPANPNRVTAMLRITSTSTGLNIGGTGENAPTATRGLTLQTGDVFSIDTTGEIWGYEISGLGGSVTGVETVSNSKQL